MNLEQAKAKLASVSSSTASQHPKVLISELCAVVKFLFAELERIKTPIFTTLKQQNEGVTLDPPRPQRTSSPIQSPERRRQRNAGDAE